MRYGTGSSWERHNDRGEFKAYPIGYFHIEFAEVRTADGKLYLVVGIDRTSKFAFAELHEKVARRTAGNFLRRLLAAVPYKVHTVLTDNGPTSQRQATRAPQPPTSRPPSTLESPSGRTPSNTPAPRTISIIA